LFSGEYVGKEAKENGRKERPNRVLLHKDSIKWILETLVPPSTELGIKEDELVTSCKPG
jgi:hypothetical protein